MKMLAIDIGASGGKAFVGSIENDKLNIQEIRRFHNGIVDIGGSKHWDYENLLVEVINCIKAAPYVNSIGIDTWGVDYGYIDTSGNIIGRPFAYRDSRTLNVIDKVHEKISSDILYWISGIQSMPINTIYQLADDVISRPGVIKHSRCFLMMPELIAFALTGTIASEYTISSTTGMLDARTRTWSDEILNAIDFPSGRVPLIVNPGELRRKLKKEIIEETGCKAEFITVATHDTASAIAAIPVSSKNWAYISCGTWALVGIETTKPVISLAARNANFTNEGGVENTIRLLKNITGLWIFEELRRVWAADSLNTDYDYLINEAKKVHGVWWTLDPNDQSFIAPENMQNAIDEYMKRTFMTKPSTQGEYVRCVLDNIALGCVKTLAQLKMISDRNIDTIHIVGGGVKNTLLCQLIANACHKTVIAGPVDATAIGNVLIQAISLGIIKDIAQGREMLVNSVKPVVYKKSGSFHYDIIL
jgi:rhamnulokinase